jgi:hypothetical protein
MKQIRKIEPASISEWLATARLWTGVKRAELAVDRIIV